MFLKDLFSKPQAREVTLSFSKESCTGCGRCMERCRHGAIRIHYSDDRGTAWLAYSDRCVGCGKCVKTCRHNAIGITEKSGTIETT